MVCHDLPSPVLSCRSHPGNLLVLFDGIAGILDSGMVGRIDRRMLADLEDLVIAYISKDVEQMREVITRAVRQVEGVLDDKPVNIQYLKFGGSARLVRVRWWIDSYRDEKITLDRVNIALELELDKAGIELPYDTYDLNVNMNE